MIVSTIVAHDQNNTIGDGDKLPWGRGLKIDLRNFKTLTLGKPIIMGRKTYDSFGGKPLSERINIVVSKTLPQDTPNIRVARTIIQALVLAKETGAQESFIIGGAQIFRASHVLWDKLYVTLVRGKFNGDVKFPTLDESEWDVISTEHWAEGTNMAHACEYTVMIRKDPPNFFE